MVLEDGTVREAGNHQTLMKLNGRYAQMISNYHMEQSKVRASQCFFFFNITMIPPLLVVFIDLQLQRQ